MKSRCVSRISSNSVSPAGRCRRDVDLKHEQGDRDREHAVAERDDARELDPPRVAMASLTRPQAAADAL
jgi:hypothetical protein